MSPDDRAFLDGAMNASPPLRRLDEPARKRLPTTAVRIEFGRGRVLCRTEETPQHLYLVQRGGIEIVATSGAGEEMVLAVLGAGAWATWLGVLDPAPLGHELRGGLHGAALALPAIQVRAAFAAFPEAYPAVIAEIGARTRALMSWIENSALNDRQHRLAHLLLAQAYSAGEQDRVALTQSQLGRLLGCSRQTLSDTLAALEVRGLVRRSYRGVRIIDRSGLIGFAG